MLENEQAQSLLNDIRQNAPQLNGLTGVSKVAASALPQRVQLLASNAGLALERMESDPAGVRLAMNNVRLSALMVFFQQCRGQGIRVLEAQITRDAATGQLVNVNTPFRNLGSLKTDGVDLIARVDGAAR